MLLKSHDVAIPQLRIDEIASLTLAKTANRTLSTSPESQGSGFRAGPVAQATTANQYPEVTVT
jgi:hypothetical protein